MRFLKESQIHSASGIRARGCNVTCVDPSQSLDRAHNAELWPRGCGAAGKHLSTGSAHTPSTTPAAVGVRLEEGGERVVLAVLLDEHLEVLVDGGDGEHRRRAQGTGRMQSLRHMPRRFKNGFREGTVAKS